jgi:2-keto-4-pentenoate hydratase
MSSNTPAALAELLIAARHERRTVSAAGWETALDNAEQAYAVQDAVAAALGWFSDGPPRHWKSGGPSRQATLTHAPLAPARVQTSAADFSDLTLHHGGIEAEIALRLGEDVTPEVAARLTPDDAASLVDAMTVSIEIVDSRWLEGSQAPALLRLADSQSHGALALGAWVPYAARDWSAQRCEVRAGTQEPVTRTGTLSVGEPTWLLPIWLRHATRHGDTVPASTVVTTGTWVGVLPARRGDLVSVEFAGIGRGTLRL